MLKLKEKIIIVHRNICDLHKKNIIYNKFVEFYKTYFKSHIETF